MTINDIERAFLKLSDTEKKEALRRLIADLEDTRDENIEAAWLEEAQRRYQDLKQGMAEVVSEDEVLSEARERLKNAR